MVREYTLTQRSLPHTMAMPRLFSCPLVCVARVCVPEQLALTVAEGPTARAVLNRRSQL